MELSLIGLQNAGKSSLVNVLTTGSFHEDMIPTVRRPGLRSQQGTECQAVPEIFPRTAQRTTQPQLKQGETADLKLLGADCRKQLSYTLV